MDILRLYMPAELNFSYSWTVLPNPQEEIVSWGPNRRGHPFYI